MHAVRRPNAGFWRSFEMTEESPIEMSPSERIKAQVGTRLAHFRKTHFGSEPTGAATTVSESSRRQAIREKIEIERERIEWVSILYEIDREAERRSAWEKRVEAFARNYGVEI